MIRSSSIVYLGIFRGHFAAWPKVRQQPLFLRGQHSKDLRIMIMTQTLDKLLDLLLVRSSFAWLLRRRVHPLHDTGGLGVQRSCPFPAAMELVDASPLF